MRVLIADGDEAFLEVAQRYLSQNGHEAETASNGLECVACLRRDAPDVVVLEQEMLWGGSDGVRALMQSDIEWSRIPVIITSTNEFRSHAGAPLAAQLQKPYRLKDLLGHLQAVLNGDSIFNDQISSPNVGLWHAASQDLFHED